MKQKTWFILCLTVIMLSCSKDEELNYSCNPAADAWVKSNLTKIQVMDRSDWINLETKFQLATYRAFSKKQKIAFWNDKLSEVMKLDWEQKELVHIQKVQNFINNHHELFNGELLSEEKNDELEIFAYQWMKYAIDSLGWDKKLVYAIAYTGYSLKDKDGTLDINFSLEERAEELSQGEPDCNCAMNSYFTCLPWPNNCSKADCEEKSGCGFLMSQTCDGMCAPI